MQAYGREPEYSFERAYYDLETVLHRTEIADSPLIVPERVTCPKCGAVDQYDLGGLSIFAMTAKIISFRTGQPDPLPRLQLVNFTTERWGCTLPETRSHVMHRRSPHVRMTWNCALAMATSLNLFGYRAACWMNTNRRR